MARRYDGRTTTFDPDGRLFQIEYAVAAIDNAAPAVGVLAKDGIVIAGEKKVLSKLLATPKSSEKMATVDEHIVCAVAGLTSDANILLTQARLVAQRHLFKYGERAPVETLVQQLADYKHVYTQTGGLRPFGVSLMYAGWDEHRGFQLYLSDPSGNYGGWKAAAMGANSGNATSHLKGAYEEGVSVTDALDLAVTTLLKALDTSTPSADRVDVAVLTLAGGLGDTPAAADSADSSSSSSSSSSAAAAPAGTGADAAEDEAFVAAAKALGTAGGYHDAGAPKPVHRVLSHKEVEAVIARVADKIAHDDDAKAE
ncbi:hypothetical protein FNF27_06549 [Cafeteria roenbergensis]|uniref:Proteasome subunit beta n=1 Tax=Cafeteria roenbergensis TaxID=33653 RepID=A0A5A8E424_CAFRO|nr:hypothetical protein FNF31_03679 [Cafeteria roenbergensis]KAA0165245.1 hypothetical protein FNF28_03526 [Cafeteria roenbergensis]KAA0170661.1 hypothetical protein FNF27_06549 [Cafeteria roenbergensis]